MRIPKIKEIIENQIARRADRAAVEHASTGRTPELRPLLDQFYRGSNGYEAVDKIKLVKLLWDAIGSEFGGRHELYERSYSGSHELTQPRVLLDGAGRRHRRPHEGLRRAVHGRVRPRRLDGRRT